MLETIPEAFHALLECFFGALHERLRGQVTFDLEREQAIFAAAISGP
jgi:hypothetical protein